MGEPTNEELKAYSKDRFVGNECETDEYRETQPEKGLSMISDFIERYEALGMDNPLAGMPALNRVQGQHLGEKARILRMAAGWLNTIATVYEEVQNGGRNPWDAAYAGAEELAPILAEYHDLMWDLGTHPYAEDYRQQIIEDYKEERGR